MSRLIAAQPLAPEAEAPLLPRAITVRHLVETDRATSLISANAKDAPPPTLASSPRHNGAGTPPPPLGEAAIVATIARSEREGSGAATLRIAADAGGGSGSRLLATLKVHLSVEIGRSMVHIDILPHDQEGARGAGAPILALSIDRAESGDTILFARSAIPALANLPGGTYDRPVIDIQW